MDYEKKYKEALERAKRWAEGTLSPERTTPKGVCETIFPELAESEDERIRKGLIDIFNTALGQDFLQRKAGLNEKEVIAYLEKQKEQKPSWSEDDEKMRDRIIDILNRTFSVYSALGTSTTRPSCPTYKNEIDWLKSLPERFNPQPKQEWSEEEQKVLDDACCWLYEYAGFLMQRNYGKSSTLYGIANKLKSLRPSWKPSEQ